MVAAARNNRQKADPLMGPGGAGGVGAPLFAGDQASGNRHQATGSEFGSSLMPDVQCPMPSGAPLRPCQEWAEGSATTHEARAHEWMAANPEAMQCFTRLALLYAGRKVKFGMKHIGEIVRWRMTLRRRVPVVGSPGTRDFKINNNHLAYIGRELIRRHPHLEEYIETRRAGEEEPQATGIGHQASGGSR